MFRVCRTERRAPCPSIEATRSCLPGYRSIGAVGAGEDPSLSPMFMIAKWYVSAAALYHKKTVPLHSSEGSMYYRPSAARTRYHLKGGTGLRSERRFARSGMRWKLWQGKGKVSSTISTRDFVRIRARIRVMNFSMDRQAAPLHPWWRSWIK